MRNERRTLRRRWQFDFGAPIASRCVKGLVDLVNELEVQKVHFQSITDGIDHKRDEETKGQSLLNGGEFFAETSGGNLPLLGVMHYHPHSRFQPNKFDPTNPCRHFIRSDDFAAQKALSARLSAFQARIRCA
jgi:hypothetical protein